MSNLPRHLRLTGGDYFVHAVDRRMRRAGMPGSICRIALRLEGPLNLRLLRDRLATSRVCDWLSRVRMVRWLPMLPPVWRASTAEAALLHEHQRNGAAGQDRPPLLPEAVLERELPAERSPGLTLDLVPRAEGIADLILSWNHALMDERGAELLLRHLQTGPEAGSPVEARNLFSPGQAQFSLARIVSGYRRRMLFARGSLVFVEAICREPIFSLAPAPVLAGCRRNHHRVVSFSPAETARIDAHADRLNAAFRRSHFHLAAAIKALHTFARNHGREPGDYLVPVPHDLRRRGALGPIFSNHLTFLFHRIDHQLAGDLAGTLAELTRQMVEQIRNRTPDSFATAMELFKPIPLDIYVDRLSRPTRGKFASFFFSDVGEPFVGMDEFMGARPTEVTLLAPAARPPGVAIVFSRFRGRLGIVLTWSPHCLAAAEVDDLEQDLRAVLLGREGP